MNILPSEIVGKLIGVRPQGYCICKGLNNGILDLFNAYKEFQAPVENIFFVNAWVPDFIFGDRVISTNGTIVKGRIVDIRKHQYDYVYFIEEEEKRKKRKRMYHPADLKKLDEPRLIIPAKENNKPKIGPPVPKLKLKKTHPYRTEASAIIDALYKTHVGVNAEISIDEKFSQLCNEINKISIKTTEELAVINRLIDISSFMSKGIKTLKLAHKLNLFIGNVLIANESNFQGDSVKFEDTLVRALSSDMEYAGKLISFEFFNLFKKHHFTGRLGVAIKYKLFKCLLINKERTDKELEVMYIMCQKDCNVVNKEIFFKQNREIPLAILFNIVGANNCYELNLYLNQHLYTSEKEIIKLNLARLQYKTSLMHLNDLNYENIVINELIGKLKNIDKESDSYTSIVSDIFHDLAYINTQQSFYEITSILLIKDKFGPLFNISIGLHFICELDKYILNFPWNKEKIVQQLVEKGKIEKERYTYNDWNSDKSVEIEKALPTNFPKTVHKWMIDNKGKYELIK